MKPQYALAVLYALDTAKGQEALAGLQAAAPDANPESGAVLLPPDTSKFNERQDEIYFALTNRRLNATQKAVLETYLEVHSVGAYRSIAEVADYLIKHELAESPAQAVSLVEGALRSFGKRLRANLTDIPRRSGRDRMGDGVADEVPLLAMFSIIVDGRGQTCHRLQDEAAVAVAAAVASTSFNPEKLTPHAVALLFRVAKDMGVSPSEALERLTAAYGAG